MSKPKVGVLYSRVRVEEKLLFEAFEKRGVSLDLLDDQKLIFDITDVHNHPYKDYDVIVERCINHSRALYSLKILNDQVKPHIKCRAVSGDERIAKVSIVGMGMRSHAGIAAQMFRTLAEEGINIQMISTSEIKITVVIEEKYTELAVRVLHKAFELDQA